MPSYGSSTLSGPGDQQRIFLGDRPQPGRHDPARLVFEDRPGHHRRISVRLAERRRQHEQHVSQRTRHYVVYRRTSQSWTAVTSFTLNGIMSQAAGRIVVRAGARELFVRHHGAATVHRGYHTASQQTRSYGGSTSGTLHGFRITGTSIATSISPAHTSSVRGNAPRINLQRPDRIFSHNSRLRVGHQRIPST